MRRHFRAAFAVALAVLGQPTDAEDVAQDAFVVAFQQLETCRHPERFAGWLVQIVRNRALNALHARRVATSAADQLADGGEPAHATLDRVGLRAQLVAALSKLPPAQREVVLLHDLDGWTHGEIAEAMGISEVMSRQHLFVARKALRGLLADPKPDKKEADDGSDR